MKSVEGYTSQDPTPSNEGPWATAPAAETPPPHEPDHAAGTPVPAAEEALELALAEVNRVEEELRSMEALHDRLRAQLQQASADADALITRASDSYAREQLRLEAELRLVQERVSGLERIRETRLGRDVADFPDQIGQAEPDPGAQGFAVVPDPDPASAPMVAAVLPPDPPVEGKKGDRKAKKQSVEGADPTDLAKASPATNQDPEGEGAAYEDHWYQVLRRDSLGGDPS